ncbi:MAG: hypothetical protein N2235_10635 [Fischerella sp.]|nr:hypothetical protein [Fischerella sp.]
MPSAINPNNINGNYPIAGQDNDSQGFRDNFTNIRNNFTYAKSEIERLQNRSVLTANLTVTGIQPVDNDLNASSISNAVFFNNSEKWVSHLNATGVIDIDFTAGSFHYIETAGSVTVNFINFSNTKHSSVRLHVNCTNTAHTLTLGTSGMFGRTTLQNINYATNEINRITISFPTVGDKFYEVGSTPKTGLYIVELQKTLNKKQFVTVTEGFNTSIVNDTETMILNANTVIASGTLTFPTVPTDGQNLTLSMTGSSVTALTLLSGAGGHTILAPITSIAQNGFARWTFHYTGDTTGLWVRTG